MHAYMHSCKDMYIYCLSNSVPAFILRQVGSWYTENRCVCVCVRLRLCVFLCVCLFMLHVLVQVHATSSLCTHTHTHTHTRTHTHTHTHIHTHTHTHTHTLVHTHTHIHRLSGRRFVLMIGVDWTRAEQPVRCWVCVGPMAVLQTIRSISHHLRASTTNHRMRHVIELVRILALVYTTQHTHTQDKHTTHTNTAHYTHRAH